MHTIKTRGMAWLLFCSILLPGIVFAETTEPSQLEALEARVALLEAQMAALLGEEGGAAQMPAEELLPGDSGSFEVGSPLSLGAGQTVTITSYDTGGRFRYAPSGGLAMLTLSAKSGYQLLCLYVTVENNSSDDIATSRLLDAEVHYGKDYSNKPQDSFFYQNSRGVFAGGLRTISARSTVNGCLLFAVPEDDDTTASESISVSMYYGDNTYECSLRAPGALLPESAETSQSF